MTEDFYEYKGITEEDVKCFKERIEKLNKRAKKINCKEMSVTVENERPFLVKHDHDGNLISNPFWIKLFDIKLWGETPKYDGWGFLASITGYPNGQNIIHKSPFYKKDVDLTKYRNEKSYCDHCKTKRYRKHTYLIIKEETNKIFQVGSTCIKDFLGHNIPSFGFMKKVIDEMEDFDYKPVNYGIPYQSLKDYIPYACEIIKQHGFISKRKAEDNGLQPTADKIYHIYSIHNSSVLWQYATSEEKKFKISDESYEMAKNIVEWGKNLKERENLNDFMYSLSVLFNNDLFEYKANGIVAAAVNVYRNEMGLEEERKRGFNPKKSNFFGEIKKRYELTVTLTKILEFESDWGKCNFHIFFDDNNNQFVWYTNNTEINIKDCEFPVEIGDKIKIKGTVKKHKEYNGSKQTVLNRIIGLKMIKKDNI